MLDPAAALPARGHLHAAGGALHGFHHNRRTRAVARAACARWVPVVLWGFLNVLLFTYSRSFYTHYYVQLAAPLCLLGGAAWLPLLRLGEVISSSLGYSRSLSMLVG